MVYEGSRIRIKRDTTEDTIRYESDEADTCPNQTATPVVHASRSTLGPVTLHTCKGIVDVLGPERCSGFRRLNKQRAHRKRHLGVVCRVFPTTFIAAGAHSRIGFAFTQPRRGRVFLLKIRLLERLFDVERCDRQRANHLEGQEADDVGGIVVGF